MYCVDVVKCTHVYLEWNLLYFLPLSVNDGEYVEAVLDRNHAENISRVLYPNDNVSTI